MMMRYSDETLMAYADGELDPDTRASIQTAIEQDAALAQRVAQHRALQADVFAAFAPVLDEPIPARLTAQLDAAQKPVQPTPVIQLDAIRAAKAEAKARRWSWPEWGALAATLLVGVVVGRMGLPTPQSDLAQAGGMIATVDGQLAAQGKLAQALSQQLASAPGADATVKIGVSFRSNEGGYCRSFMLNRVGQSGTGQDGGFAGLACNKSGAGNWQIPIVVQNAVPATPSDNYRTAGAEIPTAVLQVIDQRIAGQALDAAAERVARQRGWRP